MTEPENGGLGPVLLLTIAMAGAAQPKAAAHKARMPTTGRMVT